MLHIFRSPLISLISNDIGPFVLFVVLIWNGCILASNGCILTSFSPLDALLFHLYPLASCLRGLSCGWNMRNILLLTALIFAWDTAQSTDYSVHDSGGGEFTIGAFIEWHVLSANQRWPIWKQLQRRRIHGDILLLWHIFRANWIWCSDAHIPPIGPWFRRRRIHSNVLF